MRAAIYRFLSGAFALSIRVGTLTANRDLIIPPEAPTASQQLRANATNPNQLEWFTPGGGGSITFTATPTSIFDVAGSPGSSITLSLDNQTANTVLAGPGSGGAATPTFRSLVAADLPNHSADLLTSGTVAIARLPVGTTLTTVAAGNDSRFHNQNTDTGTNATSFQLNNGSSGVRLKDNGGALELRNAADSAFANLTVNNLTVSGTTFIVNSETITFDDNVVILNNNFASGTPTENAGFEVRRGSSTNASLLWDESNDIWRAGLAGSELAIARKFKTTFTSANISSNLLTVTHGLKEQHPEWAVYDSGNVRLYPSLATGSTVDVLILDFEGVTVTGTFTVTVIG